MSERGRITKRIIGSIYSAAAERVYDRVVVAGSLRLLGGDVNDLVLEQGRRAAETAGGSPVLDMPVGTAWFTTALARRHDGLVVGVDLAEGMVRKARERARHEATDNLVVVRADAHHLPFGDGAFGAVLCSNGLPVIPGLVETVRELARVLSPGGTLYVAAIAAPAGTLLPEAARRRLPTLLRPARDIAAAIEDCGLEVTNVRRSRLATLLEARSRTVDVPHSRTRLTTTHGPAPR